jgi:hypothetical protein
MDTENMTGPPRGRPVNSTAGGNDEGLVYMLLPAAGGPQATAELVG